MIIYTAVIRDISWYNTGENFYSKYIGLVLLTCLQHLKVVPRDIIVINSVPNESMFFFLMLFILRSRILHHYSDRFDELIFSV